MSKANELGLLACYVNSIGPLPLSSGQDEGDAQEFATYLFPHRDAQQAEAMGREPIAFSGEFQFINGLEGDNDLWPKRYIQVREQVRKSSLLLFQHPLWGNLRGFFKPFTAKFGLDALNGCRVSFTFHEVGDSTLRSPASDPLPVAEDQAATADAGLEAIGASTTQAAPGQPSPATLTESIASFRLVIEQPEIRADDIAAALSSYRRRILEAQAEPLLQDPLNAEIYNALSLSLSAAEDAAALAVSRAPQLISYRLPAPTGPLSLAFYLYGDLSRAEEIITLNPAKDFFYPAGRVLQVRA